ncbi:MAG TPA: MOSC domain-containing protein [Gaiellaceae bacterium]|nr:MOSC domain-containing protein [Gaiellaceae bacterium]
MGPAVLSVNVGTPREIEWRGRREPTAIWKEPVAGRVRVVGVNVAGDDQADRRFHGGVDKAVYAYAREDYDWWEGELARPFPNGIFGENLTLAGVDVTASVVGERWAIGSAVLEVAGPRIPCWKLGARLDDAEFPVHFAAARRPGAYLRIAEEGEVGAGDGVEVLHRPGHGVSVGQVAGIYHGDRAKVDLLLRAPELAAELRAWAEERLAGARSLLPG